jgi:hypothetical protein
MKYFLMLAIVLIACYSGESATAASQSPASTWPVKWCQAQPGMSKAQLINVMGQPTHDYSDTLMWSDKHYQFNAFLESDGSVKQLDINMFSLSDADKSALQCKKVRTRDTEAAQRSMAARAPRRAADNRSACELISEAEMSAMLGTPVAATASGRSKCIYKSAGSSGPYVEFSVDRGDGAAAMKGVGMAEKHESGLSSPYAGIGDQAVAVGPALLIRTGDDLVTLVFSGVRDVPTAAKKIFEVAKAKL